MTTYLNRRTFLWAAGVTGLALLGGCSNGTSSSSSSASASASASASTSSSSSAGATKKLVIGTLATEDLLPLWVAKEEGLYASKGLDVDIVTFQSATELISGVASGEVDLAMTDIMVTASMFASGVDVQMQWVTLGTTADQGRFGIMVGPDSKVATLQDLAGVGTLLALGEASNCKLIADDTKGENLSQSVMIARTGLLSDNAAQASIEGLKGIWNEAASMVNANPEAYRAVLVSNANLPDAIADTYPISSYPQVQLPTSAMVDPVLAWMEKKGYLTKPLTYDESTGKFSAK